MRRTSVTAIGILALAMSASGLPMPAAEQGVVDITVSGDERKIPVKVDVDNAAYARTLKRNLELSGLFSVGRDGGVSVSGAPGAIQISGRGKAFAATQPVTDDASARMAARRVADAMCEQYGSQKGFACDRIVFVSDKKAGVKELCTCYPDGGDIRQVTSDGNIVVGPRWKSGSVVFYTRYKNGGPEIWQLDVDSGKREKVIQLGGLNTGAVVSPDGRRVAAILSFQGNPELYVIDLATRSWTRLTTTKGASEGQPSWSPDGRRIVYVSDETRHPQLHVIDVAGGKSTRLTSKGSQNVDPDWGVDGRITYISKRGGASQVAVIDPAVGEGSAKLVTEPGTWTHPSWARDARHVTASRDGTIFCIDTQEGGDAPARVFSSNGKWITPSWSKR